MPVPARPLAAVFGDLPDPRRDPGHQPHRPADLDAIRDDLPGYLQHHLGDPDRVMLVDGTGFLMTGAKPCGAARQSSAAAGRIGNSRVGVFLADAGRKGQA